MLWMALLLTLGCGDTQEDFINLDGVLQAFLVTTAAMQSSMPALEAAPEGDLLAAQPEMDARFLIGFRASLNRSVDAVAFAAPLGVRFQDGQFLGFADRNTNGTQESNEPSVFLVFLDSERDRLIASDLQHHDIHREQVFKQDEIGLFGTYVAGRMRAGQRAADVSTAPFLEMRMQPPGYHRGISEARQYGQAKKKKKKNSRRARRRRRARNKKLEGN